MKTVVQLCPRAGDDRPRAELLFGAPCEVGEGRLGPVAGFESGEIVAYLIRSRRRCRLFVFRTLDVDDPWAVTVPGVRPRVQLLLELRTAGRIRLVGSLFAYLARTGRDPSALPDGFYARVGALLGGRLPGYKILPSLLSAYHPKPKRGRTRRGDSPRRADVGKGKATSIEVFQGMAASRRQARRRHA